MSSRQYSDNPSSPSFPLEMEVDGRDGLAVIRNDAPTSRWCHSRNLALIFLFVLAFYIASADIFESRDLTLPDMDDDGSSTPLMMPIKNDDQADLEEQDDEDDNDDDLAEKEEEGLDQDDLEEEAEDDDSTEEEKEEGLNQVDLNSYNPKRDGVEFISPTCNYTCLTDRLPQETPLYPGQVLCNRMYRFGMNDGAELFLQDCQLNTTTIFWSAKDEQLTHDQYPVHFEMKKNGYFYILSDPTGQILLEKHPKRTITYHHMCLYPKPKLDCPYLHLHPDGVLVLNWIDDDNNQWMDRDVKQQYVGLFPDNR